MKNDINEIHFSNLYCDLGDPSIRSFKLTLNIRLVVSQTAFVVQSRIAYEAQVESHPKSKKERESEWEKRELLWQGMKLLRGIVI